MARHAIGPMILAASILAVPVLAATQPNDAPNNSPAAASSSRADRSNMSAGMTAHPSGTSAPRRPARRTARQPVRHAEIHHGGRPDAGRQDRRRQRL